MKKMPFRSLNNCNEEWRCFVLLERKSRNGYVGLTRSALALHGIQKIHQNVTPTPFTLANIQYMWMTLKPYIQLPKLVITGNSSRYPLPTSQCGLPWYILRVQNSKHYISYHQPSKNNSYGTKLSKNLDNIAKKSPVDSHFSCLPNAK